MIHKNLSKADGEKRRMIEVIKGLKREYPEAQCSLFFESPFQLLVATILSAQCTDERVNQVTPPLFKTFPDAKTMARASVSEIEALIRSVNFFKNKARSLKETSQALVQKYNGKVPMELEQLIELRGVGRKTANVVLGVAFEIPGLVVDTHVKRLAYRLGFTKLTDPVKIEHSLMQIVPKSEWTSLAHLFILHGRTICTARKAKCDLCVISRFCPKVGVPTI